MFDNPIGTMYGPYFLIFYGFTIVFILLVLGLIKTRIDKTDKMNLPPIPSQIDPHEIAYLRGGTNELARSVIFSLLQKNLIQIENDGKTGKMSRAENPPVRINLKPLEEIALQWIGARRETNEIFGSNGLVKQLEIYGENYKTQLEKKQLLVDSEKKSKLSTFKWLAFLFIAFLGVYKILAAFSFGRANVIGIVFIGIIGIVLTKVVCSMPRLTKLGKSYLERLQIAFETLKSQTQTAYKPSDAPKAVQQTSFAGVDPLLLSVGVFGGGILAGTVFDHYNQTFQKAEKSAAISSGSCGSGCGSCSSNSSCSSGGSSCSSGSSCGSGCGGGCGGCGG